MKTQRPFVPHRVFCLLLAFVALMSRPAPAATLPSGFTESPVATGLASPTAMQFAPDGRLFVCEQGGRLRVIKNGTLLPTPFLTVTVSSAGERGLLGVAFDPDFAANHFVYVYYTATSPAPHNRISRFTASTSGDVAVAGSELVIFELNDLSSATNHNGGALNFGPDRKLYAAVGENANGANAQAMSNLLGKMLRINTDGSIPVDNPFFATASGKNRAIWALGLRNPFTFAFRPSGPEMFINDVGEMTWEEINDGLAGANYGWPTTEGMTTDSRFKSPRYAYNHSGGGCAITGGAFYSPLSQQFPSSYADDYFFADYCGGWIRKLDRANNSVANFASGIAAPVDLKVADDGSLYYLARGSSATTGVVYRVQYASVAPTVTTHPASQAVAPGAPVTFSVRASGTSPLRYQWQRNSADITGATSQDYTIMSVGQGDNGAMFQARVSNNFGSVFSNQAVLTGSANQAATAPITHVASAGTFSASTTSRSFTVSPAAIGNLLVVGFDSADPAANPGISDTGGHTWKVANAKFTDNPHHQVLISWYAITNTTSPITITAVSNRPNNWISMTLDQFSGVNTSNPLDQHVESRPEGSASNPAIGSSMTPSVDNELVWAFAAGMISGTGNIDGSAASPGGDSLGDDRSEYRILTGRSGVPMTASFTTYSPFKYNILSATFRPATGNPPANQAPTATITQPAAGTLYSGGSVINFAGTGTDPESSSPLPASAFTWRVDFHHDTHTHPFMPDTTGMTSGSLTIPTMGETAANVWYRIYLTVRDSGGLTHTVQRDILPRVARLTLATSPAGLQLNLDGQPVATPISFDSVVGIMRTLEATTPQTSGGTAYQFASWSDGGARVHAISTPASNTTYTAAYSVSGGGGGGGSQGVVSIDFVGSGTAMGPAESAGVVARANWNNATGATRSTPLALVNETGGASGATVTWTAADVRITPITDQAGNRRMMKGYLYSTETSVTTVTVNGLPAAAYDVYVYADGNNAGESRTAAYAISGAGMTTTTVNLTDAANTDFNTAFIQANNSPGNYVKFSNVAIGASGFTLQATPGASSGTRRAAVNAVQIVPTGAPPAPDFTIAATPGSRTVTAGSSTSYTVTVGAMNGFAGAVSLAASGLPANTTATFTPSSVTGSGTATLNVTTAASTPVGSSTLTITGTAAAVSHTATTALIVATAPPPPSAISIWSASATPSAFDTMDNSAVELGLKFRSDVAGTVTGVRFYKGTTTTGTHTGTLWSLSGTKLASATFTGESASGWQQVTFSSPVAIAANTVYVVSYHTDVGQYASTLNAFATAGVDKGPLHALRNGVSGGNGVYRYGGNAFPASTYNSSNYWVDVVFVPAS